MTIDIEVKGARQFGKGGNVRIISRGQGTAFDPTATQIISSPGPEFTITDDLADNTLITTLSLDGDPPGTWAIQGGSWAKVELNGDTSAPTIVLQINDADGLDSGDQGSETVTITNGALSLELTITVISASAASPMTTMLITNSSGSIASGPVVFGLIPIPNTIDPSTECYASSDMTIQEDNRSTDRSGYLRVASGCAWVTSVPALGSKSVSITKQTGSPSAGATKSIGDLLTAAGDWDEEISAVVGGTTYSVSLRDVINTGTSTWDIEGPVVRATKWRDGPVCKEYVISSPLYNGSTPHPLLHLHGSIAFFSGDNFSTVGYVRTQFRVENGWAFAASPAEIIGSGSIDQGVSSPSTTYEFTPDDVTGINVTIAAGVHNNYRNLTRASGTWSDYIVGSTVTDAVDGFIGFVTRKISTTEIEVRYIAGSSSGTLTSLIAYPFSWHWGASWLQEVWWPSQPPLRALHNFVDSHNSQLWPNFVTPSDYIASGNGEANEERLAEWDLTGTNPFRVWRPSSGGTIKIGEETQDSQAETRVIPGPHRSIFENDSGWIASRAYDRALYHGLGHLMYNKRWRDDDTGLPVDIDDHLSMRAEDMPFLSGGTAGYTGIYYMVIFGIKRRSWRDHAHYIPYLLTGDYWWLVGSQQDFIFDWSNGISIDSPYLQGDIRIVLDTNQQRTHAFTDARLAQLATMLPDSVGDLMPMTKARFRTYTDYNFNHLYDRFIDDGSGNTGYSSETPAGPNFTAADEPFYMALSENNGGPGMHWWQGLGYWSTCMTHRVELNEANADTLTFYQRQWDNNVYSISHPDILAKGGTEDENRGVLYGRGSFYTETYDGGPYNDWSGIWDTYGTPELAGGNRARRAQQLTSFLAIYSLGIYHDLTLIQDAYDWVIPYTASLSDITLDGNGDPDWTDTANWDSSFLKELIRPRS